MSIINEALKKAGIEKESGAAAMSGHDSLRRHLEIEFQRKKKSVNWGPLFVLLVLFLITGPIIAPVFSTSFKNADFSMPASLRSEARIPAGAISPLRAAPVTASHENRKTEFGIEEAPLFTAKPPAPLTMQTPSLNLSGIVYSPKESYCLLNGRVATQGETIDGAKLVEIKADSVKVLYEGQPITLTISD